MAEPPTKKKRNFDRRTELKGWIKKLTRDRINKIEKHEIAGDRKWLSKSTGKVISFTTPVPVSMKNVLIKWR